MSTKNLGRTVIEGGRHRQNKFARRHSNAVERAHVHQLERALCAHADAESAVFRLRKPVWQEFDDKLGPARRWLRSQVGRPWDKVRSELFARFDTRTTAGRHIVFDHLLEEVRAPEDHFFRTRDFWISPHGILQYRQRKRKQWAAARRTPALPEPEWVLRDWLGARRVIERGERLYWLLATRHGGFRQHLELNEDDDERFRALPRWFRELFSGPLAPAEGSAH
jgi:hypothetical protein